MYPKAFFDASTRSPVPGTCFVIMPFGKAFDPVFKVIQKSLADGLGFLCTRTDELLGGGNIIEDILTGLASSELIIADLTRKNPNVYYELGLAHMTKAVDKVLLLSQDIESIPFDLRQYRHLVYTRGAGLRLLGTRVLEASAAVASPVHRIFVDGNGQGSLPEKLMGSDHCLYAFRINGGITGFKSTKLYLEVTRYIMGRKPRTETAFSEGIGIKLGERRQLADLEWELGFEKTPDGRHCFRIAPAKSGASTSKKRLR